MPALRGVSPVRQDASVGRWRVQAQAEQQLADAGEEAMTDSLRALLAAATPGPWRAGTFSDPDAALTVALRNAAPLMLDVIEAARTSRDARKKAPWLRAPGESRRATRALDNALARLDVIFNQHPQRQIVALETHKKYASDSNRAKRKNPQSQQPETKTSSLFHRGR